MTSSSAPKAAAWRRSALWGFLFQSRPGRHFGRAPDRSRAVRWVQAPPADLNLLIGDQVNGHPIGVQVRVGEFTPSFAGAYEGFAKGELIAVPFFDFNRLFSRKRVRIAEFRESAEPAALIFRNILFRQNKVQHPDHKKRDKEAYDEDGLVFLACRHGVFLSLKTEI